MSKKEKYTNNKPISAKDEVFDGYFINMNRENEQEVQKNSSSSDALQTDDLSGFVFSEYRETEKRADKSTDNKPQADGKNVKSFEEGADNKNGNYFSEKGYSNTLVKQVAIEDIIGIMTEKLNNGGRVTFTPRGKSMLPMLRDGEDVVILEKPKGRLRMFDVPLYKRKDGSYILHRVVSNDSQGNYVLCGDNQTVYEYGVTDDDIIGVVVAFIRKGKLYQITSLKYRMYVSLWYYVRGFRRTVNYSKRALKQARRKGEK